jgi:hypothetical protein
MIIMVRRSTSTIQSQFQTRWTRLLYFIYRSKKRRIRNDPGIKSKLRRAFNYESDGHLYHDIKYLFENGLLEEKDGFYVVTRKGRQEFRLLSTLWSAIVLSLFLGPYIMALAAVQILTSVTTVGPEFVMLLGVIMLGYGATYWFALRAFTPRPPDLENDSKVLA